MGDIGRLKSAYAITKPLPYGSEGRRLRGAMLAENSRKGRGEFRWTGSVGKVAEEGGAWLFAEKLGPSSRTRHSFPGIHGVIASW